MSDIKKVLSGRAHNLVLKSDSTIWAWGNNSSGQVGDGSNISYNQAKTLPIKISNEKWKSIYVGDLCSFAIALDGSLWGWGSNSNGQLAYLDSSYLALPTKILDEKFKFIEGGDEHTLAIKLDSTLWGWGRSDYGQLGSVGNIFSIYKEPQQIGSGKWLKVSAGGQFSVGIKADSSLWSWGRNDEGQVGNGIPKNYNEIIYETEPVLIDNNKWISIDAGYNHTLAIKSDSTLWAWGYNINGALGDGTNINRNIPTQISAEKWVRISAGENFSIAMRSDSTLFVCGSNNNGQLGTNNNINQNILQSLNRKSNGQFSTGQHSIAILENGSVPNFVHFLISNGKTTQNSLTYNIAIDDNDYPITEKGLVYSEINDPLIENDNLIYSTSLDSNFTIEIGNLNPKTIFNVRAFAINEKGIKYSEKLTNMTHYNIETKNLTNISTFNVKSGIEELNIDTLEFSNSSYSLLPPYRGLVYSKSPNSQFTYYTYGSMAPPLRVDNGGYISDTSLRSKTYNGTVYNAKFPENEVELNLNNLEPNTTYYIRSFYRLIHYPYFVDGQFMYGNEYTFTTHPLDTKNFQKFSFQGILEDNLGNLMPDGNYNISFKIYYQEENGQPIWAENQIVNVKRGIFNVVLGKVNPINLGFDTSYFLGIKIENEEEMTPRTALLGPIYKYGGFGR